MLMKKIFNGKGYKEYRSKEAQIKFADSLVAIGIAFFVSAFSPLIKYALGGTAESSLGLLWVTVIGIVLGVHFRNKGLEIIDEIESKSTN